MSKQISIAALEAQLAKAKVAAKQPNSPKRGRGRPPGSFGGKRAPNAVAASKIKKGKFKTNVGTFRFEIKIIPA